MHTDTIRALIDSRVSRRAFARTALASGFIAAVQPAFGPAATAQSEDELSDEDMLQVLAILFGNSTPGTDRGGFLPEGANGAVTRV